MIKRQINKFFGLMALAGLVATFGLSTPASAAPKTGEAAPAFNGKTSTGEAFSLADQKGKTVVLEWTNHECPFVKKHYETHNMQKLQKELTDQGVVWVSIVSSAPGKQGHLTPEESQKVVEEQGAHPTFKLLDESGEIGKLYDAKTTPHMFVINPEGTLVYQGAIDDNSSYKQETVEGATNYVLAAVKSIQEGKDVEVPESKPYGCGVKY